MLQQGQRSLASALSAFARVYEHNLYMANLFTFLATEEDEPDEPIPATFAPDAQPPEVRFDDVSYRYPGAARDALHRVSLTLRPGETVALVGRNGAGKTTLVKLLVGIYRPTHGRILLDGVDTATMSPPALRRRVAVPLFLLSLLAVIVQFGHTFLGTDLLAVKELVETGRVSLAGLITHHEAAVHAAGAYATAFGDSACLKMVLDWRHHA